MDRIQELLGRITELSDDELNELRDLVMVEIGGAPEDAEGGDAAAPPNPEEMELAKLEELAEASTAIKNEFSRRDEERTKRAEFASRLNEFKDSAKSSGTGGKPLAPADAKKDPKSTASGNGGGSDNTGEKKDKKSTFSGEENEGEKSSEGEFSEDGEGEGGEDITAGAPPEGRGPKREKARTTVITAGADLPGIALGAELHSREELANAMLRRINSMRGIRGADGDKMIVASAELASMMNSDRHLKANDAEENLRKIQEVISPRAIVAAGGLGAPEESRYELFGVGDTDRPVRSTLPVFTSDRGGIRFMRPPTLNDVNGVVGIWTVEDDINAVDDPNVRKPSFRVEPGPEIVVNTQAITMIMTFGNLMSRAYPELVARHTDLAEIAHARVAEQQLLTQIGALSTAVTGRTQKLSAVREILAQVSRAAASYRNRHRIKRTPLKAIMPEWFKDLLIEDVASQHPGDGLEVLAVAETQIDQWFRSKNINVTWAMDGEAGQDYASITNGSGGLTPYPANVVWYLFAEGTFSLMDGGTLDLGLVRDSTLNAANDYQMFMETFESVVKFGHESLRITSPLVPTGQGTADVAL